MNTKLFPSTATYINVIKAVFYACTITPDERITNTFTTIALFYQIVKKSNAFFIQAHVDPA